MPRLGRCRLDVPLARTPSARLRRLRRPRPPRRPRCRSRCRCRPLRGRAWTRGSCASNRRRPRRRCARCATPPPRVSGSGRRDTRRRIRSRPFSTGSCRAARPAGSRCAARTASCARSSGSRGRRRRRTAPSIGLPVRVDETNPETTRGLIRDEILPLLRRLHPGAETNLLALGDERPRLPRGLEASLVGAARIAGRHEGGRPRRRRARRPRVRHAAARGHGRMGAVDARGEPGRSRGAAPTARGSSGRAPQEGAGSVRGREGAESGARRPGRWSSAPARSSRCRESPSRPAGTASSRPGRDDEGEGRMSEVDHGVGEILIDEASVQGRVAARSEPRSRPTTRTAICSSWACSKAPSSSWPT